VGASGHLFGYIPRGIPLGVRAGGIWGCFAGEGKIPIRGGLAQIFCLTRVGRGEKFRGGLERSSGLNGGEIFPIGALPLLGKETWGGKIPNFKFPGGREEKISPFFKLKEGFPNWWGQTERGNIWVIQGGLKPGAGFLAPHGGEERLDPGVSFSGRGLGPKGRGKNLGPRGTFGALFPRDESAEFFPHMGGAHTKGGVSERIGTP